MKFSSCTVAIRVQVHLAFTGTLAHRSQFAPLRTLMFNFLIDWCFALRPPPAQMLEHLSLQCVRGNSVFAYGVETGSAAMIEAVIDQFPWDEVGLRQMYSLSPSRAFVVLHLHSVCYRHRLLMSSYVSVTTLHGQQAVDALCAKNMMGETPLMHAARAPAPGAFMAVATFLPTVQVRIVMLQSLGSYQTSLLGGRFCNPPPARASRFSP